LKFQPPSSIRDRAGAFTVANRGSAATLGNDGATGSLQTWTDTVWLARDATRPGAHKGDLLLGSFSHVGPLEVGEDYRHEVRVTIPEGIVSGEYFLTVWSDAYDLILEDTLAENLNPDDPHQADNNNYQARPIHILGLAPPDLEVRAVVAPETAQAGADYPFSYTVHNRGDVLEGAWSDAAWLTDEAGRKLWHLGDYAQQRRLENGESYTVTVTVPLAPALTGGYLLIESDVGQRLAEADETNNARAAASQVTAAPADLRVSEVVAQDAFSGEETWVTWTVVNDGGAVWAGTKSWSDAIYFSADPEFIPSRATFLGAVEHAHGAGLAAGGSYTAQARVRLPAGTDGHYYLYVITDRANNMAAAKDEMTSGGNEAARLYYAGGTTNPGTVFEAGRHDNNRGRGELDVIYREPDLVIEHLTVSDPQPRSGQTLTVTWTVSNQGTRATRTSRWQDGVYLSRDAALDPGDVLLGLQDIVRSADGVPAFLPPGASYTASLTVTLPESIGGEFTLIVRADTAVRASLDERSTIRDDLPGVAVRGDGAGSVREFQDEGNNEAALALPITRVDPPDLRVAEVAAPTQGLAGQPFSVDYRVSNAGGDTPSDQGVWYDLV
jgi:hypothetical protein